MPRHKRPSKSVEGLLKEAEAVASQQEKPVTIERTRTTRFPDPEENPRQRREHRLIPEQKPLDWFTALEKYNPI